MSCTRSRRCLEKKLKQPTERSERRRTRPTQALTGEQWTARIAMNYGYKNCTFQMQKCTLLERKTPRLSGAQGNRCKM
ncbi:hypothetical protein M514_23303 [Trichuris suis]|uniref:Uncharacterized protein n=1 Tax=Trichuris suis TaxID=68888 RepID=A0A085N4R0_9BILA|nr:hypothetical protein M514_23303 [Trichuris suis]